jgi:hypothetical protein
MSTLGDIQAAIERLPETEREQLESHILARRFGLDRLEPAECDDLLASLDQAEAEIEAGQGRSADELRSALRTWLGR